MLSRALLLAAALASSPCDSATTSSTGGSGGSDAGACDPTLKCGDAIDPTTGDPTKLCPGTSAGADYSALITCGCSGPCAAFCADNTCQKKPTSSDCTNCLQDATAGCGNQLNQCLNGG